MYSLSWFPACRACLIGIAFVFLSTAPAFAAPPLPRPKPVIVYLPADATEPARPASNAQPPSVDATATEKLPDTLQAVALLSRLTWLVAIIGLAVIALSLWGNLTARNTARRRTRAYLAVRPGAAPRLDTDWTDATIIVKNHGLTPALNVDYAVTLMMFDYPELPLDNVIGAADKLFGRKSIMLAPGAEITLPLRTVLSDERLCAIGEVRYADAFKTPRFVRFCFMYGGAEIIARGEMQIADKGNDAN